MGNVKPDQSARAIKYWRGPIFETWDEPYERSKDGWPVFHTACLFKRPNHVTFPICAWCLRVIWDEPLWGEEIPEETICSACFCENENENGKTL